MKRSSNQDIVLDIVYDGNSPTLVGNFVDIPSLVSRLPLRLHNETIPTVFVKIILKC